VRNPTALIIACALLVRFGSPARADDGAAGRAVLQKWLASASSSPAAAPASTALPFEYRTTNVKKQCEGTFKDAKALAAWWKCFTKAESLLLEDFKNGGAVDPPSPAGPPPKSLAKLAKTITTPGTWAQGVVTGDGMTSHFFFLTTESGQLAALLVDVDFF
jgi:hypothetical protein